MGWMTGCLLGPDGLRLRRKRAEKKLVSEFTVSKKKKNRSFFLLALKVFFNNVIH